MCLLEDALPLRALLAPLDEMMDTLIASFEMLQPCGSRLFGFGSAIHAILDYVVRHSSCITRCAIVVHILATNLTVCVAATLIKLQIHINAMSPCSACDSSASLESNRQCRHLCFPKHLPKQRFFGHSQPFSAQRTRSQAMSVRSHVGLQSGSGVAPADGSTRASASRHSAEATVALGPCKLACFLATAPNTGLGTTGGPPLVPLAPCNPNQPSIASASAPVEIPVATVNFYEQIGAIAAINGVCIDLFAVGLQSLGLSALAALCRKSGGACFFYPSVEGSALPQVRPPAPAPSARYVRARLSRGSGMRMCVCKHATPFHVSRDLLAAKELPLRACRRTE
jgi:hypothetical protein